jgi:hypothetical protein
MWVVELKSQYSPQRGEAVHSATLPLFLFIGIDQPEFTHIEVQNAMELMILIGHSNKTIYSCDIYNSPIIP